MRLLVLLLSIVSANEAVTSRQRADKIGGLPGLNFVFPRDQYSGYLCASPACDRHLFYWLVESQGNVANDPLILWFNGGPGCSSLTGMLVENGPFHVNQDDSTLWENVYAWNKLGSTLYLEGPTGVGFSYADNVTVYAHHNDDDTAMEFFQAISDFFANVRPDWKSKDFYVTGESYAGVYIPTVTQLLVQNPRNLFTGSLKGIAIGNGILSERLQHNSVVDLLYFHGIFGQDTWETLRSTCCPGVCTAQCDFYSHLNIDPSTHNDWTPKNTSCGRLAYLVSETLEWNTRNDAYNLYQDCYSKAVTATASQRANGLWRKTSNNAAEVNYDSTDANNGFSCWSGTARNVYLNRPDVQVPITMPCLTYLETALHVHKNWTSSPNFRWMGCSGNVSRTYFRQYLDMGSFFDYIYRNSNIRMLIYNGDVDTVCNFLGDQWFMTNFAQTHSLVG